MTLLLFKRLQNLWKCPLWPCLGAHIMQNMIEWSHGGLLAKTGVNIVYFMHISMINQCIPLTPENDLFVHQKALKSLEMSFVAFSRCSYYAKYDWLRPWWPFCWNRGKYCLFYAYFKYQSINPLTTKNALIIQQKAPKSLDMFFVALSSCSYHAKYDWMKPWWRFGWNRGK